jgi:hypothetical protein
MIRTQPVLLITVFVIICLPFRPAAQPSLLNAFETPLQVEMKAALKDVLFLVRTEYALEDRNTGQQYGRANKPYFNRSYAVGVAIEGQLVLHSSAARPWETDPEFDRYQSDTTKMPVLKGFALRPYRARDFEPYQGQESAYGNNLYLDLPGSTLGSLPAIGELAPSGCALYMRSSVALAENEQADLELHLVWCKLSKQNPLTDRHWTPDKLIAEEHLLGAVYVEPRGQYGRLEFAVFGLLTDQEGWKVWPLVGSGNEDQEAESTGQVEMEAIHVPEHLPANEELSPIGVPPPSTEEGKGGRNKKTKD